MALVIDPVCGMEFDHRSASARSRYQDRTYHFCHPVCKDIFDSDPALFVSEEDETDDDLAAREVDAHPQTPNLDVAWETRSL